MSDFYDPKEENDIPNTSKYMQFEEGDNRFRILGSFKDKTAIQGIEYWKTIDGKRQPIRIHRDESVPVGELELNKFGEPDVPKFFWAFPVWNYDVKQIQILEITQKSILRAIKKVIDNPKWGSPMDYDFIVTRIEEKGKTTYTVTNDPKEDLDKAILKVYKVLNLNMDALFSGGDPFMGKIDEINPDDIPV